MKCPKCGYIGFEATVRCRNCGYDFALAAAPEADADLPLTLTETESAPADVALNREARPTPSRRRRHGRPDPGAEPAVTTEDDPAVDMPLFGPSDGAPLIRPPATPRAPLAVRRTTPAAVRTGAARGGTTQGALELEQADRSEWEEQAASDAPAAWAPPTGSTTFGRRVGAAAIDLSLSFGIDLAVLYFTLRLCRLQPAEVFLLPPAPLALFFLVLNGGYLFIFTAAGGRTLGKMAVGSRVVGARGGPVRPGQASLRTLAALALALPLGLTFLSCLVGRTRRSLHDRLAGTWVVPAA